MRETKSEIIFFLSVNRTSTYDGKKKENRMSITVDAAAYNGRGSRRGSDTCTRRGD